MTNFQILWTIAGFIIGWIGLSVSAASVRVRVPRLFLIGAAFVGALIAYTLVK